MTETSCILITGGAARIGAALARHCAQRGHDLVLHYHRSHAAAEALSRELRDAHGVRITLRQADLSDAQQCVSLWQDLPPVQHVIHNASLYQRDRLEAMQPAQLRAHLSINLEAPLLLSQGFMQQLAPESGGTITILGDGAKGWSIASAFFSYSVSKLAWESLLPLLAAATAPRVRTNLLALGPTLRGEGESEALYDKLAAAAPLQRTGTPQEVITAWEFLQLHPAITGQILSLSNGLGTALTRSSVV